jgi:hypothetical protein
MSGRDLVKTTYINPAKEIKGKKVYKGYVWDKENDFTLMVPRKIAEELANFDCFDVDWSDRNENELILFKELSQLKDRVSALENKIAIGKPKK